MKPSNDIESVILDMITRTTRRYSRSDVVRELIGTFTKADLKKAFDSLISLQELEYIYEYGQSYLVPAFNKPVRISEHIRLVPFNCSPPRNSEGGTIDIRLENGSAFGSGRHPSTQLALSCVEKVFRYPDKYGPIPGEQILDIGTGSGVLVIAAILLGAKKARAIDLDPCAVAEARHNIELNHMENKIRVSGKPFEPGGEKYAMVLANLRLPSLTGISTIITSGSTDNAIAVFSGIKKEEVNSLKTTYARLGWENLHQEDSLGWSAIIAKKGPKKR
ncbi:MAG: methyltransferase [Desulfobacteraceae bacterium]|nr:methyltransferase [Desulfobacteraceae bacterium]